MYLTRVDCGDNFSGHHRDRIGKCRSKVAEGSCSWVGVELFRGRCPAFQGRVAISVLLERALLRYVPRR